MTTPRIVHPISPSGAAGDHLGRLARRAMDPMDPSMISYHDFLDWADEDTLAEWVDGKIEVTSPASLRHQQIGGFLYGLLSLFTSMHERGAVLMAPFQMKLPRSGREPDLLFVASEHLDRLRRTYLDGPADLVVEIVSPESGERDRVRKFSEYERGGVPEYWLIDPESKEATFYQRNEHGRFTAVMPDVAGIYHARVLPGLWLDVAWLWRDPLPAVVTALHQIMGEAFLAAIISQAQQAE